MASLTRLENIVFWYAVVLTLCLVSLILSPSPSTSVLHPVDLELLESYQDEILLLSDALAACQQGYAPEE